MPFLDHLEELRWRLLKSLLAIALGTLIGWFVMQQVDVIAFLKRPIAPYLPDGRLVFTSPTEPLLLTLKFAFLLGLVLSSPVVLYQVWAFLAPALYDREKRVIVPALSVGVVLFLSGAAAGYRWALPAALDVLFGFQRADLAPFITIDRYFSFAAQFLVAFGVIAELPLVVTLLAALGVVTPAFLARHRRYAIVVGAVVAAFLTPPDAVSMLMMMVPILLLYEVSIWGAWVASRRRARRVAGGGAATAAVFGLLLVLPAGALGAQGQPPPADTTPRPGQPIDTTAAKRLGLPTGPTRRFPASDPVIDSLLKLAGFRATRYAADTVIVAGDDETVHLRGKALVERDQTVLEADSIRYHEASCRLDARGNPFLFDQGTVLAGEGMRYDTCTRRGIVENALTDFDEGGATWYLRGDLAVDSGATVLYGSSSDVTTCELPVAHYHFHAREIKWLNKHVMVARPAVLYIRDVPILWLPFIFQDIRRGRRSGVLVPRFGLNDLVRTARSYQRHVSNVGYYFAINDYLDALVSVDWHANRNFAVNARAGYRWLDRFLQGSVSYSRVTQLDRPGSSSTIAWSHSQSFDSRTTLTANVNYATGRQVLQSNTIDPYLASASLQSSLNFSKRFDWGMLTLGGTRRQDLTNDEVSQGFPTVDFVPSPLDIGTAITWSPTFSFSNQQGFRRAGGTVPVPGDTIADTVFFDSRATALTVGTPIRIGQWTWSNTLTVADNLSSQRREFLIPDSTVPGGVRRVLFGRTFETRVDWQTGINLPPVFRNTWRLQPSIAIVNRTGGPFMIRNQFTGGEFVRQGKRLQFSVGLTPTFYGFFPGVGPIERIRHTLAPTVTYAFAPASASAVPEEFARAVDPEGTNPTARRDPQQTIRFDLTHTFDAKLRPTGSDTTTRRVKLLAITGWGLQYNFERAKQPGLTGWQTQTITTRLASDLLQAFSVELTHDLWDGPVGFDSTRFDPFLQNVATSFAVTPATIRGVLGLFGVGRGAPPPPPPAPPPGDTTAQGPPGFAGGPATRDAGGFLSGLGAGGGFSLTVRYSSSRSRADTTAPAAEAGRRTADLNLTFSPTPKWQATWSTQYDLGTRQFAQHVVHLQRDLHRWQATFTFLRGANGNFAFNFSVSLTDQPDIKFDYDQQSYAR